MSIVSWKIGEWGEEFGGMVGGGTVLGSTIRTFYRLRFSIAHAIQDPYSGSLSRRDLYGNSIASANRSVDPSLSVRLKDLLSRSLSTRLILQM